MSGPSLKRRLSSSSLTFGPQATKKQRVAELSNRRSRIQATYHRPPTMFKAVKDYAYQTVTSLFGGNNTSTPSKSSNKSEARSLSPTKSPTSTPRPSAPTESLSTLPTSSRMSSGSGSSSGPAPAQRRPSYEHLYTRQQYLMDPIGAVLGLIDNRRGDGPSRRKSTSPAKPVPNARPEDVDEYRRRNATLPMITPSDKPRRPTPPRPNVTDYERPRRKYRWLSSDRHTSPSSSNESTVSSRARRGKKYRSNMRDPKTLERVQQSKRQSMIKPLEHDDDPKVVKAVKRVQKLLSINPAGKAKELMMKDLVLQTGLSQKEAYRRLLNLQSNKPTLDEKLKTTPKPYRPEITHQIGKDALMRIKSRPKYKTLDDLVREHEERDREIDARLKPSVPAKLSREKEAVVDNNLRNPGFKATLSTAEVNSGSIRRLRPNTWLDDEIMNAYCALMTDRAQVDGTKRRVHYLNSFFYAKLVDQGYEKARLKRWTKKIDIFDLDVLVFPINLGNMHWTACAVNFDKKRVEYYDSMGDGTGNRAGVFRAVRGYLDAEHREKKGQPFDFTGWENHFNENTPQQDNGSDCGVFSCQTLEMITRGRDLVKQGFEFTAKDMPFMRRLMIWEIGKGKLEKREWGQPAL
ncbi:hypothetical protein IAR55_006468 [Kwoniella newhampshirensis]|uniref:Ubiquitin-like protease family profile domain-containing protein n=1 Tax=Kwoniella newhampshirensis TaxID=1651941 RepID=A0AAW0YTZ1_9TREE